MTMIQMGDIDWEVVMADYRTLTAADFDVKYPDWFNNEDFMEQLREAFAGIDEESVV